MANFLGGKDSDDGLLPQDALTVREEYVNQQVASWSLMAWFFAILLPWVWLYFSFAYGTGELLAVIAAILMHIGLGLVWIGRRRRDRRLKWVGVSCYPAAIAICLLLKEFI